MATTGELLWSGLFDQMGLIADAAKDGDFVELYIKAGQITIVEPMIPVRDFGFHERVIPLVPEGASIRVILIFIRYRFSRLSVTSQLLIKWPHSWRISPLSVVFHKISRRVRLRAFPILVSRVPTPFIRVGREISKRKALTPQHVANFAFAHVAHPKSTSRRRTLSKRLVFPRQGRLPANPLVTTGSYVNGSEQAGIPWSSSTITYETLRRSYSSVSTPGFGKKKPAELPVNPYSLTVDKTNLGQGLYFRSLSSSPTVYFNKALSSLTIIDNIPNLPSFNSALHNKALRKLIDRAEVDINNIAQDFVQFRQTTDMVASTASRIYRSVSALRKGNIPLAHYHLIHGTPRHNPISKRLSASKPLASNWLELQYGWKPLLQDIEGSMRSLAHYVQDRPFIRTVRVSANSEDQISWPVEFRNQASDGTGIPAAWPAIGHGYRLTQCTSRLVVRFSLQDNLKALMSQTGFTSPVNLAWEILPYSFVVDWFLPVGPYLESFSAFEGMIFLDGSRTSFQRVTDFAGVSFNGGLVRSPTYTSRVRARYGREYVTVTREKLTAFPSATVPEFKNPFSATHALNALALLRSVF